MAALSSSALIKQLEAVHLAFQVGAIERLYPDLGPEERDRAVKREQQRDGAFTANMRARIAAGAQAIRQERGLTVQERDLRLAQLAALEVRYLRMHVAAASWRLQSQASISRLKARGEDGAFWLLNPRSNHCPTCARFGNRWWPMSVLDRVNPSVTHPQCSCRLLSTREAENRGFPIVRGRHTESAARAKLNEAARALALELIHASEDRHHNGSSPADITLDTPSDNPVLQETAMPPVEPIRNDGPRDNPGDNRRAKRVDNTERDDRICEAWATEQRSQSAIAREVGLSQPRVRAILLARYGEQALKARGKAGSRHDLAAAQA